VVARQKPSGQKGLDGLAVSEVEIPAAKLGNASERERLFAEGLSAAAGEEAWDLVHAQHWLSTLATRRALPRLPTVVTVRDYWPICIWSTRLSGSEPCPGCSYTRRVTCVGRHRPALWPISLALPPFVGRELARRRHALESASAVIAVSRHVAATLPFERAFERVAVIPNFVEAIQQDPPRPAGVPERYALFVGKLEPSKAPDRLHAILDAARADIPLLVAGTGKLESSLRAKGGDVRYLGWVEEERALALVRHADCLLFPSRWEEPLARVLLDALALGAIVVAEPTGGTEEMIVDGESGLLGRGASELGSALRRVLDDPTLARRLREGARRRAAAVFSEEVVLPRVEALYRSVAQR
jgi:glycosyltransferase involved in cell wall biosynthesis